MSAWKPDPAGERQEVTEKQECVTKLKIFVEASSPKGDKRTFNSSSFFPSSEQTQACESPINFQSELESTA